MLPKRLLLWALLMVALGFITGCATTGKSRDDPQVQYRIAKDKCKSFGLRCGTYDFNRCIERILKSGEREIH